MMYTINKMSGGLWNLGLHFWFRGRMSGIRAGNELFKFWTLQSCWGRLSSLLIGKLDAVWLVTCSFLVKHAFLQRFYDQQIGHSKASQSHKLRWIPCHSTTDSISERHSTWPSAQKLRKNPKTIQRWSNQPFAVSERSGETEILRSICISLVFSSFTKAGGRRADSTKYFRFVE